MADSAVACPQCGWVPPVSNGFLVVVRKGQMNSAVVGTRIAVDGADYGTLRAGQSRRIELEPGPHYLEVTKNNGGSGRFRVEVRSGDEAYAEIAITLMGGMKVTT